MRKIIILLFCLPLLMVSCSSGTEDKGGEDGFVTLAVDKNEIYAGDSVNFTVTYRDFDVVSEAVIKNVDTGEALPMGSAVFTGEKTGAYNFVAEYNGKTSNMVNILVLRKGVAGLSLESDVTEYRFGVDESVSLKVYYNNVDVTKKATVVNDNTNRSVELMDDLFVFEFGDNVGSALKFTAEYNNQSKSLEIPAAKFLKKAFALRFTGTWCQYCYTFAGYMADVEATDKYENRITHVAVHVDDPMQIDECLVLAEQFEITGYPRAIWDYYRVMTNTDDAGIKSVLDGIIRNNPAKSGLAISTRLDGNKVTATIKVAVEESADYYLGVMLTQDGITGYAQSTPTGSTGTDYEHNNVLRACAAALDGDHLGLLAKGDITTREYSFDLAKYDKDKCNIIVYLNKEEGGSLRSDNSVGVRVGEDASFAYETTSAN